MAAVGRRSTNKTRTKTLTKIYKQEAKMKCDSVVVDCEWCTMWIGKSHTGKTALEEPHWKKSLTGTTL